MCRGGRPRVRARPRLNQLPPPRAIHTLVQAAEPAASKIGLRTHTYTYIYKKMLLSYLKAYRIRDSILLPFRYARAAQDTLNSESLGIAARCSHRDDFGTSLLIRFVTLPRGALNSRICPSSYAFCMCSRSPIRTPNAPVLGASGTAEPD